MELNRNRFVEIIICMADAQLMMRKIHELQKEMKNTGIWKAGQPVWVSCFNKAEIMSEPDFCDWLQFIYLPNLAYQSATGNLLRQRTQIVPQAMKFFSSDIRRGHLLRLLIELDSLS